MASRTWRNLAAKLKAFADGRKKSGPRTRSRWQRLSLEQLEDRVLPVVTASLTNGVLDIALSEADDQAKVSHPTGSIRVFDPVTNQDFGNFSDTLVKSINAHGSSLTGQAITFTTTVGLTDELKTSGLADVTVNGTYSAKSMDLEADESFT